MSRDRREELRELQAAGNPFSPPQSYRHHHQSPAAASYGSCQPSPSYGILPGRSAPALPPTAASLYAYQAPYQAPYHAPIVLRRLCLNPSLRTRTVARVLLAHWASCSPYARLCRDPKLGARLGMLSHWRKRTPGAFRRWRSWSRTRATRGVAFFGQQLQRRRAIATLTAAVRSWRAHAVTALACRALGQGAAAHQQEHTRPSTARRRLLAWRCAAVRWRAAREVAAWWWAGQLGMALERWRRLRAGRAACSAWLRKRRLLRCVRAMRAWRRGEAAREQRAEATRKSTASTAEAILCHWRHCALGRAWRAWAARIEVRARAEQLLASAGVRWRQLTRGGAFAHWRARSLSRSAAWRAALRATRRWRAHGLSAAWRSWRELAEAGDATRRALLLHVQQWCRHAQAVAWRTWRALSEARRRLIRLMRRIEPRRKSVARAWAAWAEVVLLRVEVLARLGAALG
jgi:hypothetical protein